MRPRLFALTPGDGRPLGPWLRAVAAAGPVVVLREPAAEPAALRRAADDAAALGLDVVVHERCPQGAALARALGVPVHLRADTPPVDGPFARSTHSAVAARAALAAGATYTTLSPVWAPTSKPGDDRPPIGEAAFLEAARGARIVALGGVTPARWASLARGGAWGAAVLGPFAAASADEIAAAALAYSAAVSGVVGDVGGTSASRSLSRSNTNSAS